MIPRPFLIPVSIEVHIQFSCQYKSHIFSFKFECEYHDDISYNNDIRKLTGLATLFGIDVTWSYLARNGFTVNAVIPSSDDHDGHVFQFFIVAFKVSLKWYMKVISYDLKHLFVRLVPKNYLHLLHGWKRTFKKGRVYSVVVCQNVTLYGFNTFWYSLIWFQQGF